MLTQAQVAGYLLERGLLDAAAIVDGELSIRDASRRNRNFKVEVADGPAFLLKQGLGPEAAGTVAHEALVYARLAKLGGLSDAIPKFHGYDQAERVLILELIRNAEDLRAHHARIGSFPPALGRAVGVALAVVHAETGGRYPEAPTPWVLSVHRPDVSIFRDSSAASLELIKIVQAAPGLGERLDELRGGWAVDALIHQDVKWDNVLVPEHGETVRLVDWEVATAGDACWDIGSALSQYLSTWLFSIPLMGDEPPAQFPALAGYPLNSMKDAIRACWEGYVTRIGTDGDDRLERTVAYAGARLIQTAFEASQYGQQLTSAAVLHLQLAANVLARPGTAAVQLLELESAVAS